MFRLQAAGGRHHQTNTLGIMAITLHIARRAWLPGILLMGILIQDASDLCGQRSPFDPAFTRVAAAIMEEVTCFTDRSMYTAEELILFRASLKGTGPAARGEWSRVLYVELVSAEGTSLARGKYPIADGLSSGELRIPSDLITGYYFLRCYTRWMRNQGPESYAYVPLRIINSHRPEMVKEILPEEADAGLMASSTKVTSLEFEIHPRVHERRDSISIQLSLPEGSSLDYIRACLTVVPQSARPEVRPSRVMPAMLSKEEVPTGSAAGDSPGEFHLDFMPDKYGPSLSGSLVYPNGKQGDLRDTRVHLTLMGDTPGYLVCRPDALGRFTVALPFLSGTLELFVQPESRDESEPEVRIDRDFDQRQLTLPVSPLELTGQIRQTATIMARNVQLSGIYKETASVMEGDTATEAFPFYGSPTRSVDMDRYVLLPTLEEVFLNLVPNVTPVTRRNRNSLQIYSENPTLSMFDPLVMVDQVPVFDLAKFMSIPPAKIRRIDVIDDVYVKGDLRFGGLINLRSREKDMAGIDLPPNAFFIDYLAMHPPERTEPAIPAGNDRLPDTRNTLLWLPDVVVDEASPFSLSFLAPNYPGEYVVLFRGQGPGGELVVVESSFTVR